MNKMKKLSNPHISAYILFFTKTSYFTTVITNYKSFVNLFLFYFYLLTDLKVHKSHKRYSLAWHKIMVWIYRSKKKKQDSRMKSCCLGSKRKSQFKLLFYIWSKTLNESNIFPSRLLFCYGVCVKFRLKNSFNVETFGAKANSVLTRVLKYWEDKVCFVVLNTLNRNADYSIMVVSSLIKNSTISSSTSSVLRLSVSTSAKRKEN